MKLLILTQKIDLDDDVLGFFHGWVAEFARECEQVTAVCLKKGEYDLPTNVKVLSLGKEAGVSRLKYIINFYRYIWRERNNYDAVFVHMNQVYVILGGLVWRALGKKIGFWYTHGATGTSLRFAETMTDLVFTATSDSFRLKSNKVKILGHGIDTNKFNVDSRKSKVGEGVFKIITIGRISPSKDYETLILATEAWRTEHADKPIEVEIIGAAGTSGQAEYFQTLKKSVVEKNLDGIIRWSGAIPNRLIAERLALADAFVNMSHTGGLDKAVLEAMASGLPVITCNETFTAELGDLSQSLMFEKKDAKGLKGRLEYIAALDGEERQTLGERLREIIVARHNLDLLIKKIIEQYRCD